MEVVSPGANGQVPHPNHSTGIDPELVVDHLVDVLRITLGASPEDLEFAGSLLSRSRKSDTLQKCTRFALESQVALYVQKDIVLAAETNGHNGTSGKGSSWSYSNLSNAGPQVLRIPRGDFLTTFRPSLYSRPRLRHPLH